MSAIGGDGQLEKQNDSAEVLLRRGIDQLNNAHSAFEKRSAIVTWLRGVTELADDYLSAGEGSPGSVLLGALEDLGNGITPPILQAEKGGTRRRIELDRARARAVAAVEIVLQQQKQNGGTGNVTVAISAVSHLCGLSAGALRSLRSHVHSKEKYRSVAALIDEEKAGLLQYITSFELFEKDSAHALTSRLRADRPILSRA